MTSSARNLFVLSLVIVLYPAVSHAQVRDAASKALGDYAHGNQYVRSWSAPVMTMPATRVPQSDAVARSPQPQPENRVFSYDANRQAQPSQPARRFSYEPGTSSVRPRYFAPSPQSRGALRDAGSKARGEY
jgi:hypothetical protein